MPTSAKWNVWSPDDQAPVAPLENLFTQQATSVDLALTSLKRLSAGTVADADERNLLFPSPVQGNAVYRKDLDLVERYHAGYNSTTNPYGAAVAGWYPESGSVVCQVVRDTVLTVNTVNADVRIPFTRATTNLPNMWSSDAAAQIFLPYVGLWRVSGKAASAGLDSGAVLRSALAISATPDERTRDNRPGLAGITDPYVRPEGIIAVRSTALPLTLVLQANKTFQVLIGTTMTAEFIGPERAA